MAPGPHSKLTNAANWPPARQTARVTSLFSHQVAIPSTHGMSELFGSLRPPPSPSRRLSPRAGDRLPAGGLLSMTFARLN